MRNLAQELKEPNGNSQGVKAKSVA